MKGVPPPPTCTHTHTHSPPHPAIPMLLVRAGSRQRGQEGPKSGQVRVCSLGHHRNLRFETTTHPPYSSMRCCAGSRQRGQQGAEGGRQGAGAQGGAHPAGPHHPQGGAGSRGAGWKGTQWSAGRWEAGVPCHAGGGGSAGCGWVPFICHGGGAARFWAGNRRGCELDCAWRGSGAGLAAGS